MPGLLTKADLADVQRALWDGRAKWYNLGLELGLKAGTLDAIQQTNGNNVENCFRSLLKEWLRKSELVPTGLEQPGQSSERTTSGTGRAGTAPARLMHR